MISRLSYLLCYSLGALGDDIDKEHVVLMSKFRYVLDTPESLEEMVREYRVTYYGQDDPAQRSTVRPADLERTPEVSEQRTEQSLNETSSQEVSEQSLEDTSDQETETVTAGQGFDTSQFGNGDTAVDGASNSSSNNNGINKRITRSGNKGKKRQRT